MPTLLELQRQFAARLRGEASGFASWAEADGIDSAARVGVYANNSRILFETALEQTYPVMLRRVGEQYFLQLARRYRAAHPSRAGDLHEIGRAFAEFLARDLEDSPYAWLADLARLEWACADVATQPETAGAAVTALAGLSPEALSAIQLDMAPSLRTVSSRFPVFTVWQENQPDRDGRAVDLEAGAEHVLVRAARDGCLLHRVPANVLGVARALQQGLPLAQAIDQAALPVEELPQALGLLFAEGYVARVRPPAATH